MVKINGVAVDASGMTVSEYLRSVSLNVSRVAVERNGRIVPKAQFDSAVIEDGDEFEIVSFVGGG